MVEREMKLKYCRNVVLWAKSFFCCEKKQPKVSKYYVHDMNNYS